MKKTMKRILNSLTLVAMVLVMALSVIAFTTTSGNATDGNNGPKSEQVSDGNNSGSNVNDGGNNEDPTPSENYKLSGIYQFDKELAFEDIVYDDYDALIKYFNTKDLNGVYNAVKPLGFDEFIKNITSFNEKTRAIYFNNGTASPMLNDNGIFSFIGDETQGDINNIIYTINENGEIENNVPVLKLEFDAQTNKVTFIINFSYENNVTPLCVKATLSYIPDSSAAFEGASYTYVTSTANIVTTSDMTIDINSKLETLTTLLGIQLDEGKTANDAIETGFASCSILINEDASRIVVKFNDNTFAISSINAESQTFAWNNAEAKIISRVLNLSTNQYFVQFEINIDEESKLVFDFKANA